MNNIFLGQAFAQAQDTSTNQIATTSKTNTTSSSSSDSQFSMVSFIPLILVFFIIYFLIIRPQAKREAARKEMVNNLKSGNKIMTTSGIAGVISRINSNEDLVEIEIAPSVIVKMRKDAILEVPSVNAKKAN